MRKNVMVKAWEIAKEAVVKFGGKVKEYFAESLKIAWATLKTETGAVGKTQLIGSEKQVKWANDIIAKIEAAQPRMKQACIAIVNEKPMQTERGKQIQQESLDDALSFIDSLTDFPLFKNQASMYITYFSNFTKKEEDVYELLERLFYYDDVAATVSRRAQDLLKKSVS